MAKTVDVSKPLPRDEALEILVADNSPYAVDSIDIGGVSYPYFRHAPRNLGELFSGSLQFAERPFLTYEGETLTYAEVYARASALAEHLHRGDPRLQFAAGEGLGQRG